MLYPEDEEEMKRHVTGVQLTARYHPVLTPIVEYSVHEIRNYTSVGYIAAATRMGFCILEKNFGPMLTDFLKHIEDVSDTLFVAVLIKVMEALVALHDANLLHRNLHPDAIVLTTKYKVRRIVVTHWHTLDTYTSLLSHSMRCYLAPSIPLVLTH